MSVVLESLKKSTINIGNISKSLNETKKTTSAVNDSVENISRIVGTNTRVKRELFARSQVLNYRREEASKRQEFEDQIESSRVSSSPQRGLAFSSRSDKGPLGRILGFLGFVTAGWIVENLPTWIFMGKEFVSRIQIFGRSMYKMVASMQSILDSFGESLRYSFDAVIRLDFDEFVGEGSVARSFEELNSAVQGLGNDLTETFRLFTTPLNESVTTEEKAPGLGEKRSDTMFPGIPQEGTPSRVTGTMKQALDIISGPESGGSYNAMNQGTIGDNIVGSTLNSKSKIGKNLTDMTIGEVIQRQQWLMNKKNPQISDYGVYAAGRYQFVPNTLPGVVKSAGLTLQDKFSPENQDLMASALLKQRGIQPWTVGGSRYSAKEMEIIERARREPVSYAPSSTSEPQIRQVPVGNINPRIGDRLGAGRGHKGVDLQVAMGTPLRAISDGVIVDSDYEKGWGNFLVMKDNLGIYHLYGHMQSGYKKGGPVKKGEVIGKVGMTGRTTGPHLHWEAGTGWNRSQITGRFDALSKYSKYAPFNTSPEYSKTPAQISAQPKLLQPAAITPERKGSQVVMIDATEPQAPQVSYPPQEQIYSTPSISEFKLLNNFIKNKLLLDLAYL
jgi:murein DD-endopeptidase MepM/ murein hydrolase activator NlpD